MVFGRYSFIVVVFNASPKEVSFVSPALQLRNLQLHPIQVQIKLKYLIVVTPVLLHFGLHYFIGFLEVFVEFVEDIK